ncbi:hypothetical protein N9878_00335 [bacterium]|nr:hypothetical protein [bacterium]
MIARPPEDKKIGTIIIDIYEGNMSYCSFKGEVDPMVVTNSRVALQRDFGFWLQIRAEREAERLKDVARVKAEADAKQKAMDLAVQQEKEKQELAEKQKIEKAEADLVLLRAVDTTSLTPLKVRDHEQKLKKAEGLCAKLKEAKEGDTNGEAN